MRILRISGGAQVEEIGFSPTLHLEYILRLLNCFCRRNPAKTSRKRSTRADPCETVIRGSLIPLPENSMPNASVSQLPSETRIAPNPFFTAVRPVMNGPPAKRSPWNSEYLRVRHVTLPAMAFPKNSPPPSGLQVGRSNVSAEMKFNQTRRRSKSGSQ